jgi:hypothetical protein
LQILQVREVIYDVYGFEVPINYFQRFQMCELEEEGNVPTFQPFAELRTISFTLA